MPAICLRSRYAMPATDIAYGDICPRAYSAMPDTDTACTWCYLFLGARYAMPGADRACADAQEEKRPR
eukprot:768270-Rhodomonas_salina.1